MNKKLIYASAVAVLLGSVGILGIARAQTATTTDTTASTTSPVISDITVTPSDTGATISWMTDQSADSQILFGTTTNYTDATMFDSNLVTNHTQVINGLMQGTTYHFQIVSSNSSTTSSGMSADQTFTTTNVSGPGNTSGVGSTTDVQMLQNIIAEQQQQIADLRQQVAALTAELNAGSSTNNGTGNSGNSGPATLTPSNATYNPGATVDWNGRNFSHEQDVTVMLNGQQVAKAHADDGGNFTTGSYTLPSTPGTYTYTFTDSAGDNMSSTITIM